MNLGWAIGRGIRTGAVIGGAYAIFAGLTGGAALLPLLGSFVANTFLGAGIGAATFGVTHAVVQSVPGLSHLLGDVPPKPHEPGQPRKLGRSARGAAPMMIEETDDRNVGFRRQIEEQMQRDEELREAGGIDR